MKNQIKELRVMIDGVAQLTEKLKPIKKATGESIKNRGGQFVPVWKISNSKQIEKSVDSLYLAKAWLGKCLGELGTETPYINDGKRKSVEDIEPAADKSWYKTEELKHNMNFDLFKEKNHIEKVDWLRQEIEKITKEVKILDSNFSQHQSQRPSKEFAIARTNAYNHLCEARFWLGFELERLKNADND